MHKLNYIITDRPSQQIYLQYGTYSLYSSCSVSAGFLRVGEPKSIRLETLNKGAAVGYYSVQMSDTALVNSYWYYESGGGVVTDEGIPYRARGKVITYSKGDRLGTASSQNPSSFPTNGRAGKEWYCNRTYNTEDPYYSKGDYIEEVESKSMDTYPTNGRHIDGYWYVLID